MEKAETNKTLMNLAVDIGNTSTKAAVYRGRRLVRRERLNNRSKRSLTQFIGTDHYSGAVISSVIHDPSATARLLSPVSDFVHVLTRESRYPFTIDYLTPETLGVDRLAAAAGALMYHPGRNILVIDAGSAVTIDIIAGGKYLGGSISPGLGMRFRALHQFTDRLPLIRYSEELIFPGRTTDEAITAGVVMGLKFEIIEYIRHFRRTYAAHVVVFTGGDGEKLTPLKGRGVYYYPDLVTDGLNYLLEHNAKSK